MDSYFKSERDRIMFLLLEVDGRRRNNLLGITHAHYADDTAVAEEWYTRLSGIISATDNPNDESTLKASANLKDMYHLMSGDWRTTP